MTQTPSNNLLMMGNIDTSNILLQSIILCIIVLTILAVRIHIKSKITPVTIIYIAVVAFCLINQLTLAMQINNTTVEIRESDIKLN